MEPSTLATHTPNLQMTNVRFGWKKMPWTNAEAHLPGASLMTKNVL
jgi:hypothetical protein